MVLGLTGWVAPAAPTAMGRVMVIVVLEGSLTALEGSAVMRGGPGMILVSTRMVLAAMVLEGSATALKGPVVVLGGGRGWCWWC